MLAASDSARIKMVTWSAHLARCSVACRRSWRRRRRTLPPGGIKVNVHQDVVADEQVAAHVTSSLF